MGKKNELDPIQEAIQQGWPVDVYVDDHPEYKGVTVLSATSAYIAFEPEGDSTTFTVIPWWRVNAVTLTPRAL